MLFHSLSYCFFLPLVYLIFYFTADRFRWLVLLIASYGLYATFKAPQILLALVLVTMISYRCGILLGSTTDEGRRKLVFWLGITGCVLVLATLKCLPLFFASGAASGQPVNRLLISVGVSYFTFQAISYLTDIYLEILPPEQHPGCHALYLAFFPKLLQGPIERADNLLFQLKKPYSFNYENVRLGLLLFVWGLYKKIVVADKLALYVNPVYDNVHDYSGLVLVVATYLYALQIYFDFAGYTDMALGTARIFNIQLTQNFNGPYLATSVADFWRRWHISFSRWILDYIFKPLQIRWRDAKNWGTAAALLIAFLVSGLWHGLTWGFVVWGGLHGLYMASSVFCKPLQKKIHKRLGLEKSVALKVWHVVATFNLVCFAWIFFRAHTLADALYIVKNLFAGSAQIITLLEIKGRYQLFILILSLSLVGLFAWFRQHKDLYSYFFALPTWARWTLYYGLVMFTIIFDTSNSAFIYLNF